MGIVGCYSDSSADRPSVTLSNSQTFDAPTPDKLAREKFDRQQQKFFCQYFRLNYTT